MPSFVHIFSILLIIITIITIVNTTTTSTIIQNYGKTIPLMPSTVINATIQERLRVYYTTTDHGYNVR